jgi:hypothetical protein
MDSLASNYSPTAPLKIFNIRGDLATINFMKIFKTSGVSLLRFILGCEYESGHCGKLNKNL